jgi:hypothetical protein
MPGKTGWVRWADLLRRLFEIDVSRCARCGGRLRFVAAIDDPAVIRRILGHLGLPTSIAPPLPARSPPGLTQESFGWREAGVVSESRDYRREVGRSLCVSLAGFRDGRGRDQGGEATSRPEFR